MGGMDRGEMRLVPLAFSDLDGWAGDDHAAALATFRRGAEVLIDHPPKTRRLGLDAGALAVILARSATLPADPSAERARAFFEAEFTPFEVVPLAGTGFFTGYYEPEVAGSITPSADFGVPFYRPPDELIEIEPGSVAGIDPAFRFAGKTAAGLVEHFDRAAVMAGALAGRGLELVYVHDPVDAFFIHIQGAARIALPDGRATRVTYAAKSGHPYTPIGRVLADMGALPRDAVTMQAIRQWLAAHPAEAAAVMAKNRSHIYFREAPVSDANLGPIAAAKVPLTAGRSLAVDRLAHSFHTPVWIETMLPAGEPYHRLMVAQDTGSAIVGPARGDIFFGSGDAAGDIAGAMRAAGRFVVLMQSEDWMARAQEVLRKFAPLVAGHVRREVLERGYFAVPSRDGQGSVRPLPKLGIGILPVLPGVFESRHEVVAAAKHAAQKALAGAASAIEIDRERANAYPQSLLLSG